MKKITSIFRQKKAWVALLVIAVVLVALALISSSALKRETTKAGASKPGKTISSEVAKAKAEEFINKFLMQGGSKATIKEISTEYGLYKLKIDIVSDVVESYLSKDGRLFFPQALDVDQISNSSDETGSEAESNAPTAVVSTKSDKPIVELFVMSHCPYGTQIEKGMLPVLDLLGDKISFELKFCSYAMHGEKELAEQLTQYCIQKEQPNKLNDYLKCFLGSSDSDACLAETGINKKTVASCVTKTDKQFDVMSNFTNKVGYQGSYPGFNVYKEDNDRYGVAGSPTLVINGEEIQSERSSAALLATICSAFNEQPEECQTELSSASPSAGFGYGTTDGSTSGSGCE